MKQEYNDDHGTYEQNYVFGGNRIVSEAHWAEYELAGVRNVIESIPDDDIETLRRVLADGEHWYGAANVLLGDAFDIESQRPLAHKPGVGLYSTAQGLERARLLGRQDTSTPTARKPVLKLPNGRRIVLGPGESPRQK